jgi:antitoxin CptB
MMTEDARRARIDRLKWHCRRSLLELDLVFQRFWERYEGTLSSDDEAVLARLLELEDHDLWAVVSGKQAIADPDIVRLVERLRET